MKPCLTLTVIFLILFFPLSVFGGTIRTSISTRYTVTDRGDIDLECTIRNNGDVTAHRVAASWILADSVKRQDLLGDNPAGGEIRLKERITDPDLKPGRYMAVMRVDFEEQAGKSHYAYHIFEIPYLMEKIGSPALPVSIKMTHPSFNRKAFWDRERSISLSVKNAGRDEIQLNVRLFVPEGVFSPEPNRTLRLRPQETRSAEIPVGLEANTKRQDVYHLIAWSDHGGMHSSWNLQGVIEVEDRPIYFKGYLMFAAVTGAIFFLILVIRNRPGRVRKDPEMRFSPIDHPQSTIDNL